MIDWFAELVPLAASAGDDAGLVGSLFDQIWFVLSRFAMYFRIALGIGLVIFVHELGHFVAAKTFGVKCEKFYVGFDVPLRIGPIKFPRTLGKFRYGETEYGIGVIPLGGYVKMLGQDDDPRNQESEAKRIKLDSEEPREESATQLDPRSFPAKPVWQRMVIISSGVVMNVITGVLFAAIAFGYGVPFNPAVVGAVTPGGPAWQAGIEPGGKIVAVGSWTDEDMHFREMQNEIMTKGLEHPEQPINVTVRYDSGVRDLMLPTHPDPSIPERRMIGLSPSHAAKLGTDQYADENSVAAGVLTAEDAGAELLSFNGTPINLDAIAPVTPFLHHLYTHPNEPIQIALRRVDGSERNVTLPPQPAKSLGVRFSAGPIVAMVDEGPAAKAGLKLGDRIQSVNGQDQLDAYGLLQGLVGVTDPVELVVLRGEGDSAERVELTITPVDSPQTIAPTSGIAGEIAVNSVGLAYRPLAIVESIMDTGQASKDGGGLQPGDRIKWVKLEASTPEQLGWQKGDRFDRLIDKFGERWELSPTQPLNDLIDIIQFLPEGTRFTVAATRGAEERVITAQVSVVHDDQMRCERGLRLAGREATQKATSISQALSLGMREGYRRLTDVIRFLKMIPRGQIKLRHVGGPLEIVNIAKIETEKGFSEQLLFLTMLSMNLAILNFLPIPALDGGHMMFLTYELVAGKRANEQLEFRLTVAGLLTLLMLMVVVFANDVMRHL